MPKTQLPELPCACASLRRAARLVTQLYSEEMGPEIEPTQFALLTALSGHPGASRAQIGSALGLDKTTMSRSLQVLERNGWIAAVSAEDGRERGYRPTAAGKKALSVAKAGWSRAQARLRSELKPGEWEAMFAIVNRVAEAAAAVGRN
jgi:DNA-binding MarR family transcriptional regulator